MVKSIIKQKSYFVVVRDLHSFAEVRNAVVPIVKIVKYSAIQKTLEEAEKRIDGNKLKGKEEYVDGHNRALEKSKQILNDCFGVEEK